jgi:hypothetical protein
MSVRSNGRAQDSNNVKNELLVPRRRENALPRLCVTDDELDPATFSGNNCFISRHSITWSRGYVKNVLVHVRFWPNRCPSSRELTVPKWNLQETTIALTATDVMVTLRASEVEFNACKGKDGNDNDLVPRRASS